MSRKKRLIDVDELLKTIPSEEIVSRIAVANAPTVDAVEVVRCKDCKWWKTNYMWNGNERKICAREAYEPFRKAEDFCSRGERK